MATRHHKTNRRILEVAVWMLCAALCAPVIAGSTMGDPGALRDDVDLSARVWTRVKKGLRKFYPFRGFDEVRAIGVLKAYGSASSIYRPVNGGAYNWQPMKQFQPAIPSVTPVTKAAGPQNAAN